MLLYIIAGEASGDLHGANLVKELKQKNSSIQYRAWGGDLLQAQGATIVKHYRDLAFMGFIEVVMNLKTILKNIEDCKKDILTHKPNALVLIDYPGFNLRIAEWAKQQNIKVFYYISPQIWAWKQSRVHKIKRVVDKMFVILPFEKDFYKKFDYDVDFVGHPLLDAVLGKQNSESFEEYCNRNNLEKKPIVAILPGSRKQEIATMLPIMLNQIKNFPQYQFVIAGAPSQTKEYYNEFLQSKNVKIVYNQTYDLLSKAHAAMVTSGTATLETALFNVPQVVCYKGSKVSYLIARQLIKVKYISLVNLIMDRVVVKELIQNELNETQLKQELQNIIADAEPRKTMLREYVDLKEKLGNTGASARTAQLILENLK